MSILSDGTLAKLIPQEAMIDPYFPDRLQPASYDIALGNEFRVLRNEGLAVIDPRGPVPTDLVYATERDPFILHPQEFALATSAERVRIPDYLVCRLEGKSSLGRLGLVVHSTAGWIDPGFEGQITLELSNDSTVAIALRPNLEIGQLAFMLMDQPVKKPYAGKYQKQEGTTASRSYEDFQ